MSQGKSIKLFLADGTPGGIITAEIMNWTGHVLAAPRSRLPDLLKRPEASRPGLYVLLGDDPNEAACPLAYIGETESISDRLTQHSRPEEKGGKDFWQRVFVITSKDANLTKGHLRFLESRLISIAHAANRIALDNTKGKNNEYGALPEADTADMLYFIEQIKLILPVLGLDLLRELPPPAAAVTMAVSASPVFELKAPKAGITAQAQEVDGEFIVRSGSLARAQWSANQQQHSYQKLHQHLMVHGILQAAGSGLLRFEQDYVFPSPSAAAAIVLGRSDNGRLSWKVQGTTQSYADWQQVSLCPPAADQPGA